jgi:hypothetical protein
MIVNLVRLNARKNYPPLVTQAKYERQVRVVPLSEMR